MIKEKKYYKCYQKAWWRDMDNIIINFRHIGAATHMRFIHMNNKCRLDRVARYPYTPRFTTLSNDSFFKFEEK